MPPPSAHPTVAATAASWPPTATGEPRPETDSLPAAIDAGLQCLRNLAVVDGVIGAVDVEHQLRAALNISQSDVLGRTAARVACAHLAAGDLTEAYFALLTARDQLLREPY